MPKHKHIIQNGLILHYDMGNVRSCKSGSTTVTDLINAYNGTINGSPTFSTANGGCLVCDGLNDNIDAGNISALGLTNSGSATVWLNITSPWGGSAHYPNIISKGGSAGWDTDGWCIYTFNPALYPTLNTGTSIRDISKGVTVQKYIPFSPSRNVFINITMTIGDGFYRIYYNGSIGSSGALGMASAATTSASFKVMSGPTDYYLNGKVAQVMVYNRPLTSDEVLYNYNATKYRYR